MDFHGMKRKDLQTLCKKHGIPGNLKNIEMATRLASVFQKETVEGDGIKDDEVVSKEAKRVRFSPENEVFEFTRSVKKCKRRNVRMGHAQDLQRGGIELRRSKRIVAKGITMKTLDVPRRLKRIGSSGSTQETELMALEQFGFEDISEGLEKIGRRSGRLKGKLLESSVGGGTLKAQTLLPAKRSQRLVVTKNKKDELVQNNVKDISMDVQDDPKVEKDIDVQTNTQDRRRSIRLKARAANSSMGGEISNGRPLCSTKERKKEIKTKQSKGSTVVNNSQESELVKNKTKEPLIDCEVQTTANYRRRKVQDVSKVEKVPRRSKRLRKDINVLMDKRPVKALKREKSLSELLVDGQAQKSDKQPGGANVESRSSSKKPKAMNQECIKDKPQGMIEDSPSSSETKAAESVMVIENVLASSLEKSVDSSKRTNTEELNSALMEGKCEEKLERDTILMPAIEEDKEEVSSRPVLLIERLSPASVQLSVSNPEAELVIPTSHNLVLDIASTAIAEENTKTKEKTLICTPRSELKECSSVAKLAKAEAIMENSAECWKEIHESKDDEKGSLEKEVQGADLHGNFFEYDIENNNAEEEMEIKEHSVLAKLAEAEDDEKVSLEKKIQAENIHENFSEYNTENSKVGCITENSKVGCISVGHSGNLESLDEVKDDSLEKTEQTISRESGCKLNELELRRWSSTDFTSFSPKEDNVSKCFEEDGIKALSQPLPRNKDVTVFDESAIFTTPERNLMLMEQLSESGNTPAADSVTHHKDEAVESHVVVLTTPRIDEVGKEEDETATNFLDESDAPNTTERYSMSEGSRQTEARNDGECKVIELHDESEIANSLVRKLSVEDFKGDSIERNEENRTIELQHESGICTSLERREVFGSFGQNKARESVQFYEESGLSTGLHRDQPLADSELGEEGWQEINSAEESGLFTSLETQLVSGDSEQQKAVKTGEKTDEEIFDESEMDEAAKSEEDKAVELQVDCGIFTSAEKHLLLETDEEMKGDNMTTNSHVVHDVFIASESQSHMGEFEPDEAEKTMNVDLLGESNTYNNPESHLLFGDSGVDETKKIKDHTAATCEESFVFTSPERQQILVNSEPHSDGKEEGNEVEFKDESAFFSRLESGLVLGESGQAGLDIGNLSQYQSHHSSSPKFDFRENTIADSSGSMASKVSYNHEFNVGQETAVSELMRKGSQAEDVEGLDATQGKSKKNNEHSPHVDSVNLLLNSSGGTEDKLLGFDSEVDFGNTCENPKYLEDGAADSLSTAFGKASSLTADELTVHNNIDEKAADEEMTRRETTPSPGETLHESSIIKEYLNIDESSKPSEKQVRREPILIYRTQVKLKRHDMKENAPNSKIVDNLNVTAPRTSKRQPLQELRKN